MDFDLCSDLWGVFDSDPRLVHYYFAVVVGVAASVALAVLPLAPLRTVDFIVVFLQQISDRFW